MKRFVGYYNYTVILTLVSLIITIVGMTQCLHGNYKAAILCLMLSGLCDAFDGRIARTRAKSTEDERNYGIQLDSLCDVVCFGIYPALLCYMLGCRGTLGLVCICFYAVCALIRLAYFNVIEGKRQQVEEERCAKSYHGLPVTSICVIMPIIFATQYILPTFLFYLILHAMLVVVGFAFVIDFRMPKPGLKEILILIAALLLGVVLVFAGTDFQPPRFSVDTNPLTSAFTSNEEDDNPTPVLDATAEDAQGDSSSKSYKGVILPNGQLRLQADESEE